MTRSREQNWPQWMAYLRPWRWLLDYRRSIGQDVRQIEIENEHEDDSNFHDKKTDPRATLKLPTVSTMKLELEHN